MDIYSLAIPSLAIAFHVWMIVDAVRRRAPFYWFLIILFVPFGSLVYFFMVKSGDFGQKGSSPERADGVSLDQLRHRAQETPSFYNKLALGDALESAGEYLEGSALYRQVLALEANDRQALHGLARCLLGLGRPREACEILADLMEIDKTYKDYTAALDYAEALWQSDQRDDAVGLLQGLVSVAPRINHRVALAHYLKEAEGRRQAREELDKALSEYEHSPAFVKKRDKKWAERAHRMLRELGSVS